jgi:hypothetical protein
MEGSSPQKIIQICYPKDIAGVPEWRIARALCNTSGASPEIA